MRSRVAVAVGALALGLTVGGAPAFAQGEGTSLGTIRLPQAVRANGQPLPAGTYSVRLTKESAQAVVGQPAASTRWVEFVQGGQVRGRELASVVSSADIAAVGETKPLPSPGTARVHALRGGEYVRVWLNSAGTHYLVHLSTGSGAKQ